jgi:hypothetical protein
MSILDAVVFSTSALRGWRDWLSDVLDKREMSPDDLQNVRLSLARENAEIARRLGAQAQLEQYEMAA